LPAQFAEASEIDSALAPLVPFWHGRRGVGRVVRARGSVAVS
jgi:hypothetical protein